jgi:hypothetical protein
MADNTTLNTGTGGDIIATDDLTTLNGGAVSGVKVQRVKVGFGSDASLRDVDASNGLPVVAPTLTKGTQGATGLSTQDLKDSGRNAVHLYTNVPILTTATDALLSLTGYKSGAAVAATTTPAVVTTGKTFRITTIALTYVAVATAGAVKFTLRANLSGVVAIGSPAVNVWVIGGPEAIAGTTNSLEVTFPEGLEFPAGAGIGISQVGLNNTQSAAITGYGFISIYGYEY